MTFFEANDYNNYMTLKETQIAIKLLKDSFEAFLSSELHLMRVTAPLFVTADTGLNDNLNGCEQAVQFNSKEIPQKTVEVVHSLAKWKRQALAEYQLLVGEGIYTDMNAIRKDEELDNTHSIYVDQWDWELIIAEKDRNISFLQEIVCKIYESFKRIQDLAVRRYPWLPATLPENITFISSQELENRYPTLTPKQREHAITKQHKAVFVTGIGGDLNSGTPHDLRAPDYDDWQLNGDILFWFDQLNMPLELSSMGIRVDKKALLAQLQAKNATDRLTLNYHKKLLADKLPATIGGGIGQSRLCMYFLNKVHIGQVQAGLWDDKTKQICQQKGIQLL
ncbi:MAG: aspartate--ammonia ligase [Defluviitaleaceae bacterium]|nr:aspartate--ammonia ligase [Defluviitaleaceae bacterium]